MSRTQLPVGPSVVRIVTPSGPVPLRTSAPTAVPGGGTSGTLARPIATPPPATAATTDRGRHDDAEQPASAAHAGLGPDLAQRALQDQVAVGRSVEERLGR